MIYNLLAVSALVVVLPSLAAGQGKQGDLDKLQGTWVTLRWDRGHHDGLGGEITLDDNFNVTVADLLAPLTELDTLIATKRLWSFEGNQVRSYMRSEDASQVDPYTFEIDSTGYPKKINMTRRRGDKPQTFIAIYELKNDLLFLCINNSGHGRPTEFSGEAGIRELWVLRRYNPFSPLRFVHSVAWRIQDKWDAAEWPFTSLRQLTDNFGW